MLTSRRLDRLGSGVFDRNDQRKQLYRSSAAAASQPLVDLSLGSTDLEPPPDALEAMAAALDRSGSATFIACTRNPAVPRGRVRLVRPSF